MRPMKPGESASALSPSQLISFPPPVSVVVVHCLLAYKCLPSLCPPLHWFLARTRPVASHPSASAITMHMNAAGLAAAASALLLPLVSASGPGPDKNGF